MSIPSVSSSTNANPLTKLIFIAIAVIAVLIGCVTLTKYVIAANSSNETETQEENNKPLLTRQKTMVLAPLPPKEEKPATEVAVKAEQPPPVAPVQALPQSSFLSPKPAEPTLGQLQDEAPLMGSAPASVTGSAAGSLPVALEDTKPSAAAEKFGDKLKAVATPEAYAQSLGDTSLKLLKGTFIECILETKLDTTVTGMTSCIVPKHIYSANGKTLLIERGSRVTGEYTGAVENGLNRIFVLWSQVTTPHGVRINLNSPGTDSLGGAGLNGEVDFHWWKRFGNALMFTLVQDAFDFATSKATESNGGVSYTTNTQDGTKELIQEAMKQAGNIPPTLTKNQGERIGIFVARDIDFSNVYELTLIK